VVIKFTDQPVQVSYIGKEAILNEMPPYEGGGDMIKTVSFKGTTYNDLPFKFEAGTPNIAGCIALGTAIKYVLEIGIENISTYETELLDYATEKLSAIEGLNHLWNSKTKILCHFIFIGWYSSV
jgi:cysteine desulfurase/selenocysteine lyase